MSAPQHTYCASDADYARFEAAAKACGLPVGTWVREVLRRAPPAAGIPSSDDVARTARKELVRIRRRLNELSDNDDISEIKADIRKILAVISAPVRAGMK